MNLFLPRKRHLVTAVPAVVYAVNYPIIIQVISEIQEKSCAFVEMVKIVCCHSFFTRFFFSILICHFFRILSKIFIKDRILSENRTIYNWNIVKCLANDGRKEKRMRKESKEMAVTAATMKKEIVNTEQYFVTKC